jgi:hypothetical protein
MGAVFLTSGDVIVDCRVEWARDLEGVAAPGLIGVAL